MFVQLGMTDDGVMEDSENMSYRQFVNSFLPYHPTDSVEIKTRLILKIDQDDIMWDKLLELIYSIVQNSWSKKCYACAYYIK
jgi:hypothetical protein